MAVLPRPVTIMIWLQPAASASATAYWMIRLSTSGSISLGWALVAGRKRVPNPAAGKTALQTFIIFFIGGAKAKQIGCCFASKRRAVIPKHCFADDFQGHAALIHEFIVKFHVAKIFTAHFTIVFALLENLQLTERVHEIGPVRRAAFGLDLAH